MNSQNFCLKWDSFSGSVTSLFDQLRRGAELVDVTLCCEGQRIRAHRMMLSACSPYFRELFRENTCQQLVLFLKDTSAADLRAVVEFMYRGSVNVTQSQLASFIKTAEMLQVQGLSGGEEKEAAERSPDRLQPWPDAPAPALAPAGRRRWTPASPPPPDAESPAGAEPRHKRRRGAAPERPPTDSPPPPPPPLQAEPRRSETLRSEPLQAEPLQAEPLQAEPLQAEPLQAEAQALEGAVKVEEVDLALEEDGSSELEAALGRVSDVEGFEAVSQHSEGTADCLPSAAGRLQASGDDLLPTGRQFSANVGGAPGPSQRPAEDAGPQASHRCAVCSRRYASALSLDLHRKVHQGLTTCPLCRRTCSRVGDLRRHLGFVHNLDEEAVLKMAPRNRKIWRVVTRRL